MGLKTEFKKITIKKILKEIPVMKALFDWLTDPAAVGRKRTIATVMGVLSAALRGMSVKLAEACSVGDFAGLVCKVNVVDVAWYLDFAVNALNNVVVPGTDAVTFFMGLWALYDARKKATAK